MPALVAIDVPTDTPSDYVAAVDGSCNAALGAGTCTTTADPAATWVAVVRWDDPAYRTLRIELRPTSRSAPVETRVVAFTPADPPRQRWASAGLVIAALASRHERTSQKPVPAEPSSTVEARRESVGPSSAAEPPRGSRGRWRPKADFDLAVVTGPGLDEGPWRVGGMIRAAVAPSRLPFALQLGTRLTARGEQPTIQWVDGLVGVVVRIGEWQASWAGELCAGGIVERVWLVAEDATRDEREVARRWRVGGRLAADLLWAFARPATGFLGLEASLMRPAMVVSVAGEPAGKDLPIGWAGVTGVRISF